MKSLQELAAIRDRMKQTVNTREAAHDKNFGGNAEAERNTNHRRYPLRYQIIKLSSIRFQRDETGPPCGLVLWSEKIILFLSSTMSESVTKI